MKLKEYIIKKYVSNIPPLEKLYEVEADCILPILNKEYARTMLQTKLKRVLNSFYNYSFYPKYSKEKVGIAKSPTYIFSDDQPSYFEQYVHIADICQQVWDFNMPYEIDQFIYEYTTEKVSRDLMYFTEFVEGVRDNIFNINPQGKSYIQPPIIDPNFEFQVPRLQIPGKKLYNFKKEQN